MADKTPDQEPSIEEILASIRQIISDDDDKDGSNDTPAPEPEPVVVQAAPPQPAPKPIPAPAPVVEDVLELTQPVDDEPEEDAFDIDLQETPAPAPFIEREAPKQSGSVSDILTESARTATISSMAKLAGNMPITRHREYGNITLEDLVREMLHPMLKDWLSDNLPPMVERVVQKELEKLARQAQDV